MLEIRPEFLLKRCEIPTGSGGPTLEWRRVSRDDMQNSFRVGAWLVEPSLCRVARDDRTAQVRAKVVDLLVYFAQRPGEVISKDTLLRDVWGTDAITESVLTRTITELRSALDDDAEHPSIIETIPKRGYRLIAPVVSQPVGIEQNRLAIVGTAPFVGGGEVPGPTPARGRSRYLIFGAAVGLVGGIALGVWLPSNRGPARGFSPLHAEYGVAPADGLARLTAPEVGASSGRPSRTALALSPDGRFLVFVGMHKTVPHLFRRALDRNTAELIPGTEGADVPFISPDSTRLGFWAAGALHWMPLEGGTIQDIVRVGRVHGASWADERMIVYGLPTGVMRVDVGGGEPQRLTSVDREAGETWHDFPQALAGGGNLVLTVHCGSDLRQSKVVSYRADEKQYVVLAENATDGRIAAGGRYLLFMSGGALMGAPFDTRRLATTGSAVKLIDGVMRSSNTYNSNIETGAGQFAVSDSGHLAYLRGGEYPTQQSTYAWFDRRGHPLDLPIPAEKHSYGAPRLGPGDRIVTSLWQTLDQDGAGIFIYDPTRNSPSRVPFEGRVEWPIWTPDGRNVVFLGMRAGRSALFRAPADGSGPAFPLTPLRESELMPVPASWSADGNELLLLGPPGVFKFAIDSGVIAPVWESKPPRVYQYRFPALSPDRRWLALTSNDSGREEVYVTPYPSRIGRRQVSAQGGHSPLWSRRGTEIVYYQQVNAETGRLMSVAFRSEGSLPSPHLLFEKSVSDFGWAAPLHGFAVTPDGERFLALARDRTRHPPPETIDMVFHWLDRLPARLAGSR